MSHMADQLMLRKHIVRQQQQLTRAVANEIPTDMKGCASISMNETPTFDHPIQSTLAMPVLMAPTLRTFNGRSNENDPAILTGEPVFLSMTTEDIQEINRCLLEDDSSMISGIPLCNIFKTLTIANHLELPDIQKKIKAWAGTRFFITKYPKTDIEVLLTIGSAQKVIWADDDISLDPTNISQKLVMVIPDKAQVKITTLTMSNESGECDRTDDPAWIQDGLRQQLLLLHHEAAKHTKPTSMLINLRNQVWWPGMPEQCKKHYLTCSICMPLAKRESYPGIKIIHGERFSNSILDLKILPKDIANRTGCPCILTCVDDASSFTVSPPPLSWENSHLFWVTIEPHSLRGANMGRWHAHCEIIFKNFFFGVWFQKVSICG